MIGELRGVKHRNFSAMVDAAILGNRQTFESAEGMRSLTPEGPRFGLYGVLNDQKVLYQ